jgi:cytochrome c-type biogenesis protein
MLQQQVSAFAALVQGLVSFLSPCVLPLVPAYLGMLAGQTGETAKRGRLFLSGALFVLGFSAVFIAMGATASALGRFLTRYSDVLRIASGLVVIVMGCFAMGVFNFRFMMRERRFDFGGLKLGAVKPLVLGIGFAFGWTPCVGPVLTSVLLMAANAGTVWRGVGLLALYSLGMGLPFLLIALLSNVLLPRVRRLGKAMVWTQRAGGLLLVLMGILLLSGWMEKLAAYSAW